VLAPVMIAFAAACGFALSTSIQHRVAGDAPTAARHMRGGLLGYLVTNPQWLFGVSIGGVGWVLHVAALRLGSIVIVQPVIVSGIVLAVPIRAALDRRLPSRRDMRLVGVTAVGLGAFLAVANPTAGRDGPDTRTGAIVTVVGLIVAALIVVGTSRLRRADAQALLLGSGAGVLFGLAAGLIKLVAGGFDTAVPQASLVSWPLWALVVGGGFGVGMNQRAYHLAPLSVSMPILNIVAVIVALVFGTLVFGETPARTPSAITVQALSLVCMAIGLRQILRPGCTMR
jgi:drug/metabolite transporter (DMT)-like permease